MRIETPQRGLDLHRPDDPAGGVVFAFDRDYTVDVNPPRADDRPGVPLSWVGYLAHHTDHVVYATGNQVLKQEAGIPGIAEIVAAHPDAGAPADDDPRSYGIRLPRRDRVAMLADLYPDAGAHVVVDDADLSDLAGWEYYPSWEFVPAAREGAVVADLPPDEAALDRVDVGPREGGLGSHF